MNDRFDVIVVGVGAMGSSACWHLARRGVAVLGLEQFNIPHDLGSSHGFSRMIRSAYYEHPDYVPLIQRAFEFWQQLEEESLTKVLHKTGGIYIGRPEGELIAGSLAASRKHNLPHDLLSRHQLQNQFPQFQVSDDFVGFYEYDAGYLLPEIAISVATDLAMRHGATIHGNEPVLSWTSDEKGVSVSTARGTYHADELIFTAGAWTDRLLRDLGVPLLVTRQVLGWVQPLRRDLFLPGVLPVWAISPDDASGLYYGFPLTAEHPGLKLAHHFPGEATTPDTIDRSPREDDEATFRRALKTFLPDADGPLLSIRICMYTNSPDHHFILDRHPAHPRVTLACGFSGHGFKFASVIGETLADLATRGATQLPVQFLGLHRFART